MNMQAKALNLFTEATSRVEAAFWFGSSRPLLPVFTSLLHIFTLLLHHYYVLLHYYYIIITSLLHHYYIIIMHYCVIIALLLHQRSIAAPEGGARWTAGYVRLDERKSWERNRSSPPRFAYRTGAWPCEMLRF